MPGARLHTVCELNEIRCMESKVWRLDEDGCNYIRVLGSFVTEFGVCQLAWRLAWDHGYCLYIIITISRRDRIHPGILPALIVVLS